MSEHFGAWASGLSFLLNGWTMGLKMLAHFYWAKFRINYVFNY